jgi:threonine 3-dehydrogenase
MGASHVLNPTEVNVVGDVQELTEGEGVDVLLEMSGAASAVRDGFQVLKPGGEAALLGLPGRPVEFDFDNQVIFKGVTVHGIVGRRLWETWYQARGLLRSGAVDLSPLVTHRFPLERFEEAFALMTSGQCGKVVLLP